MRWQDVDIVDDYWVIIRWVFTWTSNFGFNSLKLTVWISLSSNFYKLTLCGQSASYSCCFSFFWCLTQMWGVMENVGKGTSGKTSIMRTPMVAWALGSCMRLKDRWSSIVCETPSVPWHDIPQTDRHTVWGWSFLTHCLRESESTRERRPVLKRIGGG